MYWGDAMRYKGAGLYFFENLVCPGKPDSYFSFDMPGYPFFLAILFKLFNPITLWISSLLQIIFNALFFCLSIIVIYKIASILFSKRVGFFSAAIYSFYPSLLSFSLLPYPDSLFLLLLLSAIYFFILYIKKNKTIDLIAMSFFTTLSLLTREIAIFIPLVLLFLVLLKNHKSWRRCIKITIVSTIVYVIVLIPYFIYSYKMSGQIGFSKKTYMYCNFLNKKFKNTYDLKKNTQSYRNRISYSSLIKNYFIKRKHFFGGTGTISMLRILKYDVSDAKEIPKTNKEFFDLLRKNGSLWLVFQWFSWVFIGVVYVTSLLSILYLFIKRQFFLVIFFVSFILYFLVIHFFHFNSRYFTSIVPFLSILSAYFASCITLPKSIGCNYED